MRVIVFGGRDYADQRKGYEVNIEPSRPRPQRPTPPPPPPSSVKEPLVCRICGEPHSCARAR